MFIDDFHRLLLFRIRRVLLVTALTFRPLSRFLECVNSPGETLDVVVEHAKA